MKVNVAFKVARNRLPAIPPAVRNALAKVVRDTASDIAVSAQALAPVLTGELRDSIGVEVISPLEAEVHAQAGHAIFVEYGTHRMSASPFLTPAFEGQVGQFAEDAARAIEDAARKAAG